MIRLDLLANLPHERRSPRALIPLVIGGVAVVAVIVTAAVLLAQRGAARAAPPAAATAPAQTPAAQPAAAAAAPAPAAAPVAAPVGTLGAATDYRAMRLEERICYEMLFTRRALALIAAVVPAQVAAPDSLALDSFETIRATGRAQTKEQVMAFLAAFQRPGVTLLPKPYTRAAPAPGGFEFALSATAAFGLQAGDPFADSAISRLPSPDRHAEQVKAFQRLAAADGVTLRQGLSLVSRQKAGSYRRYVYRLQAATTYADLSRFAGNLYSQRVLCSIGKLRFSSGGSPALSAEVYFMARE